jgi:hypothetical protein
MMKTAVLASLVASAAAFAPAAQQTRASSAISAKPFENELGAMTPVSNIFVEFFDVVHL